MQADKSEMMQKVLTMLSNTQDVEMTCDQVFAALDQFTELAARGEDVSQLMPLIQHHLTMCYDCMEEYKVLKKIVLNAA
jgi:predicted component of type VI protein secretion system